MHLSLHEQLALPPPVVPVGVVVSFNSCKALFPQSIKKVSVGFSNHHYLTHVQLQAEWVA
jgi:hypothetical protein